MDETQEVYDGEVALSDIMELAESEEVHLELLIPAFELLPGETGRNVETITTPSGIRTTACKRQGGFRMGVPLEYHPRKETLRVYIQSMGRHLEIKQEHIRFALIGPGDDAWKYKVV